MDDFKTHFGSQINFYDGNGQERAVFCASGSMGMPFT